MLGLSGGPDSVCAAALLKSVGAKVFVAHFNHNLRGQESDADEAFCRKVACGHGWDFFTRKWDRPKQSEEKCRLARQQFLQSVLQQTGGRAIVLGHHFDDRVETILFNILRGTGLRGLSGMQTFCRDLQIFRPLLEFEKTQILQFLQEKKIPFRLDRSNLDEKFSRNFLRLQVLPSVLSRFPQAKKAIAQLGQIAGKSESFLDSCAAKAMGEIQGKHGAIALPDFFKLPPILQDKVLQRIFAPRQPAFDQIENVKKFLQTGASGKQMNLLEKTLKIFGKNLFVES